MSTEANTDVAFTAKSEIYAARMICCTEKRKDVDDETKLYDTSCLLFAFLLV